jgi:hypothetical protein
VLWELGFASAKQIDSTRGFGAVKKRFMELQNHLHNEPPDADERRRLIYRIGLALAELSEAGYAPKAIETILRTRFKVIAGAKTISDLDTVELVNLLRTLSSRLSTWTQLKRLASLLRSLIVRLAPFKVRLLAIGSASADLRHDDCNAIAADMQNSISDPQSIAKSAVCYEQSASFFPAG